MGTNYYLHKPGANHCDHCGREDAGDVLHIGKSSFGWCFALHVMPDDGINDLPDWQARFGEGQIRDEYGDAITPAEMMALITERKSTRAFDDASFTVGGLYCSEAEFHAKNYSERGPNGLLRHQLDQRCIAHGAGTWDCIVGEFS